jgi:hypothetical protein
LQLGQPLDVTAFLEQGNQRRKSEEELYDLIEGDPLLREIMARHGATRDVLRDIYQGLLITGAGQWARGHYVPASALAFGATLEFLLTTTDNARIATKGAWETAAFKVLDYFERGSVRMRL